MSAFIIATVQISDAEKFGQYSKQIDGLAERHGGRYVFRGPVADVLEGDAQAGERVVVLEFADADAARGFYNSDSYQAGKAMREGAATLTMRLVGA